MAGQQPLTREEVYVPLFALVTPLGPAGAPGTRKPFKTVSREVIEVQRVKPDDQPVLFMDEAFEDYQFKGSQLVARVWTVYFHIGCNSKEGTASSTVLNPLVDAVAAALQSTVPGEEQQLGLGDRVTAVRIKGMAMKNLGNNSTEPQHRQAVCYLPVEIILPL